MDGRQCGWMGVEGGCFFLNILEEVPTDVTAGLATRR